MNYLDKQEWVGAEKSLDEAVILIKEIERSGKMSEEGISYICNKIAWFCTEYESLPESIYSKIYHILYNCIDIYLHLNISYSLRLHCCLFTL